MPDDDGGTRVDVDTDLSITGKVAQFGRGVLADVSAKLLGQFVDEPRTRRARRPTAATPHRSREPDVDRPRSPPSEPTDAPLARRTAAAAASGPRQIDSPEAEPVDLLEMAGALDRRGAWCRS